MSSASLAGLHVHHEVRPHHRHHASHFEKHKTAFERGGGRDDAVVEGDEPEGVEAREEDEKVFEA